MHVEKTSSFAQYDVGNYMDIHIVPHAQFVLMYITMAISIARGWCCGEVYMYMYVHVHWYIQDKMLLEEANTHSGTVGFAPEKHTELQLTSGDY